MVKALVFGTKDSAFESRHGRNIMFYSYYMTFLLFCHDCLYRNVGRFIDKRIGVGSLSLQAYIFLITCFIEQGLNGKVIKNDANDARHEYVI